MTILSTREFCLTVSMSDLIRVTGEGDDACIAHPMLVAVLDALELNVDLRALYLNYFDHTAVGTGDVHVFAPSPESTRCFALDLYRDPTDQLDIISLAVVCDTPAVAVVKSNLRAFFDAASCQILYEEGNVSGSARRLLDIQQYPLRIPATGYQQQRHFIAAGVTGAPSATTHQNQ